MICCPCHPMNTTVLYLQLDDWTFILCFDQNKTERSSECYGFNDTLWKTINGLGYGVVAQQKGGPMNNNAKNIPIHHTSWIVSLCNCQSCANYLFFPVTFNSSKGKERRRLVVILSVPLALPFGSTLNPFLLSLSGRSERTLYPRHNPNWTPIKTTKDAKGVRCCIL